MTETPPKEAAAGVQPIRTIRAEDKSCFKVDIKKPYIGQEIIIEHNTDIIRCADWIIDLGPEGGAKGGYVMAAGTPEEIKACPESITGQYF